MLLVTQLAGGQARLLLLTLDQPFVTLPSAAQEMRGTRGPG